MSSLTPKALQGISRLCSKIPQMAARPDKIHEAMLPIGEALQTLRKQTITGLRGRPLPTFTSTQNHSQHGLVKGTITNFKRLTPTDGGLSNCVFSAISNCALGTEKYVHVLQLIAFAHYMHNFSAYAGIPGYESLVGMIFQQGSMQDLFFYFLADCFETEFIVEFVERSVFYVYTPKALQAIKTENPRIYLQVVNGMITVLVRECEYQAPDKQQVDGIQKFVYRRANLSDNQSYLLKMYTIFPDSFFVSKETGMPQNVATCLAILEVELTKMLQITQLSKQIRWSPSSEDPRSFPLLRKHFDIILQNMWEGEIADVPIYKTQTPQFTLAFLISQALTGTGGLTPALVFLIFALDCPTQFQFGESFTYPAFIKNLTRSHARFATMLSTVLDRDVYVFHEDPNGVYYTRFLTENQSIKEKIFLIRQDNGKYYNVIPKANSGWRKDIRFQRSSYSFHATTGNECSRTILADLKSKVFRIVGVPETRTEFHTVM